MSTFSEIQREFWKYWWDSTSGLHYPVPDLANKELDNPAKNSSGEKSD